jgi:hypothetical protein
MSPQTPIYHSETARLRRLACNHPRIIYREHAELRMIERHITTSDVEWVLQRCPVVRVEVDIRGRGQTWKVQGKDSDDREIAVVIAEPVQDQMVIVITLFPIKE